MTEEGHLYRMEAREELEAFVGHDGRSIVLRQGQEEIREEPALIYLSPDQVETVIGWLQALLDELNATSEV